MQNSTTETVDKAFESMFGKEKSGRVRCYGRTMTPTLLKKNQEIVNIQKGHALEISGMAKKIEGLEAMMKFMLKQQNPDLNEEDIEQMMSRVLGKENSVVGPHSSASTHIPNFDQVYPFDIYRNLFCFILI